MRFSKAWVSKLMLECSLDLIFTDATGCVVNVIQIDPEVLYCHSQCLKYKRLKLFPSKYFTHKLFISMIVH